MNGKLVRIRLKTLFEIYLTALNRNIYIFLHICINRVMIRWIYMYIISLISTLMLTNGHFNLFYKLNCAFKQFECLLQIQKFSSVEKLANCACLEDCSNLKQAKIKWNLVQNLFIEFLSFIIIFCLDKAAKRTRHERSDCQGKHNLVLFLNIFIFFGSWRGKGYEDTFGLFSYN